MGLFGSKKTDITEELRQQARTFDREQAAKPLGKNATYEKARREGIARADEARRAEWARDTARQERTKNLDLRRR